MIIKIGFVRPRIKNFGEKSDVSIRERQKLCLNALKTNFTYFLGCKCVKNIQNADLLSNWIVFQLKKL